MNIIPEKPINPSSEGIIPEKKEKKRRYLRIAVISLLAVFVGIFCFMFFFLHAEKFIKYELLYRSILKNIQEPKFPDRVCNILDYGASRDEKMLNTEAIRRAIEDCSQKGGGTVEVPDGKFLTGPINLQSNINLNLSDGAELSFSDDRSLYLPQVISRFQGMEYYNFSPMIYGKDITNVAITGKGRLAGNGAEWVKWSTDMDGNPGREKLFEMADKGVSVEERIFGEQDGMRPSFIQLVSSKNILIDGVNISDSPMWTVHPIYTDNIIIRNVTISTDNVNTDGVVIDSSKNVLIENSEIKSGDDAISLKSGLEKDGWRVGKPTENIVMRNLSVKEGHAGLSIGSEMSGDVRNVILRDSIFRNTDTGMNVKSLPGRGGTVENVWLYHLTFAPVEIGIKLNMDYESGVQGDPKREPIFRDFLISRIRMHTSDESLYVEGLGKTSMSNIYLIDSRSNSPKTYIKDTDGIDVRFSNINE
jgi:polygalacturonase